MRSAALLSGLLLLLPWVWPVPARAQAPRPMALAELVAFADQRNPQIQAARKVVAAAEAAVALAKSGRGPTVTVSSTSSTAGGGTATATPTFSFSVAVSGSYVVYDSGQIAFAVRQAEANLEAARFALEAARQDVSLSVARAFVDVLRAERTVRLREQTVVLNRELLRSAEGQFRAGVVPRADVVRAQSNLAAAEGELVAARNAVDQAKATLNTAVGQAPAMPALVAGPPPVPPVTLTLASLPQFVDGRPDVRRALAEITAAEAAVSLAQAGGGVRVTLDGRVSRAQAPSETTTYSVGATASLPVSDAGRVTAAVAQAQANLEAARARIETVRLAAQQQGVAAFLSLQDARARIESARAALAFAQESMRLAQGRYGAGAGPLLEVTDAQTTLVSAEIALVRAELDELASALALRHAVGRSVVDGQI